MKALAEFTKTTLVGGVLVLLPIYLSILLLAKTLAGIVALLAPVTAAIPAATQFREVLAILLFLAACFLAGLVVRTGPGGRGVNLLERRVLQKVPGYAMIRGLVTRVGGEKQGDAFAPALVEIEDALVPALVVEHLPGDRYTVLVPSVPTPAAGAIYVLPASRVHMVDVPLTQMLHVYSRWGEGTGELLTSLEAAKDRRQGPG